MGAAYGSTVRIGTLTLGRGNIAGTDSDPAVLGSPQESHQARRFGNYCQMFGKGGWLKCHEARLRQEAENAGAEVEKAAPVGDNQ